MNIIRIISLFVICLTLSFGVAAQGELVPTKGVEYGNLSELGTGRIRVFVHTENLGSREKILKELAKYARLEVVGRVEDADLFLIYGTTLVANGANLFSNDLAEPSALLVHGGMVALRLVDDPKGAEARDGTRTRILWYAQKQQTFIRTDQFLNTSQFGMSGTKSSLISTGIAGLMSIFPGLSKLRIGHSPEVKATRAFLKDLKRANAELAKVNSTSPSSWHSGNFASGSDETKFSNSQPDVQTPVAAEWASLGASGSRRERRRTGPTSVLRTRQPTYPKSLRKPSTPKKAKRGVRRHRSRAKILRAAKPGSASAIARLGSLLGHHQLAQARFSAIIAKQEMPKTLRKTSTRKQFRTCAKCFAKTAKPLFMGPIPIALQHRP